ncbi:MAG TPA: sugar ABC transporter permease [Thermomicrobiales bacterium]|nr:sugar ABC transporter permease [Thermomicrobiales bacterium]
MQGSLENADIVSPRRTRFRMTYMQQRNLWGFLFAVPALVFFALFAIFPILRTFYLSFFTFSLVDKPIYTGLDNYRGLIHDGRFHASLINSFVYVFATYVPVCILALILALALNTKIRARGFFRTMYFVPVVMSWVVVSAIWKLIFNRQGLMNTFFLDPVGISPKNWLTDVDFAPTAIVIMSVWKEVGFFMVVFLAGLQNIPSDYYEAARVDGSNSMQVFRFITMPLLRPTLLFVSVIAMITGLQVFVPQWMMTAGGPVDATLVMSLNIYQTAFVFLQGGRAAAMSVVLFVIIGSATLVQFWLNRIGSDS